MKRSFVADASVAIAWVHPAQASRETDAMLDCLAAGDSLVVPALWPLEVANALTVLRRRRKLTPDEARTAVEIIRELPTVIDHEAAAIAFTRLVDLASRTRPHRPRRDVRRTGDAQIIAPCVERRADELGGNPIGRGSVAKRYVGEMKSRKRGPSRRAPIRIDLASSPRCRRDRTGDLVELIWIEPTTS